MTDLSIIIVNYKTPQLVLDCLKSVYAYTSAIRFEVIIIDNQSEDASQAIVQAAYPAVRWFDMSYNAGFARANNLGIQQAKGRNILLLNSDTLLLDDVLSHCVRVLDTQPDVAAVSAIQLQANQQVRPNMYTTFGQMRRAFYILPGGVAAEKFLYRLMPDPQYADSNQVEWLSGAFLMTRPSVIEKAGALDESFFMYGEDVEWGYRLGKQGRLLLLQNEKFVHLEYGSDKGNQQRVVTHINRFKSQVQVSQLLWVRKQYGAGAYLILMGHYVLMIPIVFIWKVAVNLRDRRLPWAELDNQWAFTKQVGIFLRFFWKTLFNRSGFYKV